MGHAALVPLTIGDQDVVGLALPNIRAPETSSPQAAHLIVRRCAMRHKHCISRNHAPHFRLSCPVFYHCNSSAICHSSCNYPALSLPVNGVSFIHTCTCITFRHGHCLRYFLTRFSTFLLYCTCISVSTGREPTSWLGLPWP